MKVVLGGEPFDYDGGRMPMSDALWIEHVYKRRYAEWEADLNAGSAKALAMLACLIWRRDGRDVPLQDLLDGKTDFDLAEMIGSMAESLAEAAAQAEDDTAVPTPAGPAPAGIPGIGTGTSASSPKRSGTPRRK